MWYCPSFFNVVYYIDDFHMFNNPYIPERNPTLSQCIILLICCWIQLASICWGFLHLYSEILFSNFLYMWLCLILVTGNASLIKKKKAFGSISSAQILWNNLRKIDVHSLNVWYNTSVKPSSPKHCFARSFGYWFSLLTNYRFSISLWTQS